MRFIEANKPPQELIAWISNSRRAGQEINFDTVGTVTIDGKMRDVKSAIKRQRLFDQGFICAYTLLRIDETTAHIEHIKPRSISKREGKPEETLQYTNLVACFPASGGDKSYGCGAPVRENKSLAISPTNPACERAFTYASTGRVKSAKNDEQITKLIEEVLCLNSDWLLSKRRQALFEAGVAPLSPAPLSLQAAEKVAASIFRHTPESKLTPFCSAIAHAALQHAALLKKLATKRKFILRARKAGQRKH